MTKSKKHRSKMYAKWYGRPYEPRGTSRGTSLKGTPTREDKKLGSS